MLGRLIRPALMTGTKLNFRSSGLSGVSSTYQKSIAMANSKVLGNHNQYLSGPTQFMSTATSNYHYHQKPSEHKHDTLWKAERYLSLVLLGVLPAAWIIPHPIMDYAVTTSLVVHVHWGVEAIVTDYVRPSIFGPIIPKISIALVYILSILAAGGLFVFNWTDVGITQALKMLSSI